MATLSNSVTAEDDMPQNYRDITVEEAKNLLGEKEPPTVIDIRTPEEYRKGAIANAKTIDFLSSDFDKKISKLDRKSVYIIHCQSGGRSSKAIKKFKALGFTNVYHLKSGWAGWNAQK